MSAPGRDWWARFVRADPEGGWDCLYCDGGGDTGDPERAQEEADAHIRWHTGASTRDNLRASPVYRFVVE